jgi:hypothetical protein
MRKAEQRSQRNPKEDNSGSSARMRGPSEFDDHGRLAFAQILVWRGQEKTPTHAVSVGRSYQLRKSFRQFSLAGWRTPLPLLPLFIISSGTCKPFSPSVQNGTFNHRLLLI